MIRGIIFDYGGTIDTNSVHWSEVIWDAYQDEQVAVSKEHYRLAYVHGERTLAKFPLIRPEHNMLDLLRIKLRIQVNFLIDAGFYTFESSVYRQPEELADAIARRCYDHVLDILSVSRPVLQRLAERFPLVLVSNFYGNIQTILSDFQLLPYFRHVVESAVVGIRKPNPAIFQLGVDHLGMKPEEVLVVGDSYTKDIIPAASLGCPTVWIQGKGWGSEPDASDAPAATYVIHSITQLLPIVEKLSS